MYVNRESQNIIADKIEDTANVFRIKLQRLWQGYTPAALVCLQCRCRSLARLWQATQELAIAKDRSRREKFLSRVCFIMPIQGQGFAWTGEAKLYQHHAERRYPCVQPSGLQCGKK